MFGPKEKRHTLGEHAILGDEDCAELRTAIHRILTDVADLKARVDSQFTTIAAHAEIARQQAEFARSEARADLERTRETLVDLIEQLRRENRQGAGDHITGSRPGPAIATQSERLESTERGLERLEETVERCFSRQQVLANTMEAFIDTIMAEQRGEPVAGLSLS